MIKAPFHVVARLVVAVAFVSGGARLYAQGLPAEAIAFGDGRVTLGGDVSATVSCAQSPQNSHCGDDLGFFNYSDYEHSTLRMVRLNVSAALRATRRVSLLTDIRSENGAAPQAYALYVRVRPWLELPLDVQVGRVPPTFGAFGRRTYASDNLLIGYPLAYQYLTSLRSDALPATVDELLTMRGRGWLSNFSLGNLAADRGLPLSTAFHWDTGVQVHAAGERLEATGSITTGSLTEPRGLRDNNGGRQLAGRLLVKPAMGLQLGVSGSRGAFLSRGAAASVGVSSRDFPQTALGADVEYSRGYYLLRAESLFSTWHLPTIGTPLHALGTSVEGRYKFHPAWYVAARVDHLGFNTLTGVRRRASWDAAVTREELGGGYRLHRNVEIKASLQHDVRPAGRVHHTNILAAQIAAWF